MSRLRQFLIWFGCGAVLAVPLHYAVGVAAAALEDTALGSSSFGVNKKDPVLLDAEKLGYDRNENVAVAEGAVELTQGNTILLADRIAYNQRTGVVMAQGNIRVLDQDGNTFFADEVELTEGFREGVIDNFRARLSDDSLFAAREARKLNENVTVLGHAVYSPCKVCYGETDKDPLWQLKAEKVTIDQAEQRITYNNAFMEVYGVPVLYTPYFSHPTPGADNKSGILIPQYGQSGNLGAVAKLPVYFAIAPDKDMTLTPIFTSDEGPVLAAEYRQLLDKGQMEFSGSITYPEKRDADGNAIEGHEIRGHIRGKGNFGLRENWGWGFDINRATDDTYLRKYEFGNEDTLTSRLYLEGLRGRGYAIAQALSFQGLRVEDDPDIIPLIAPLIDMEYETEPGPWNSRLFVSGNAMSLIRDIGAESRRLSVTGGWRAPFVTQGGQVFELSTSLRVDGYTVSDVMTSGGTEDGTTGRIMPELALRWRYPLIRRMQNSSLIVEPVVNTIVSPNGGNPEDIPNEDDVAPEFSDTNIFDDTHFAGYDRVENGARVNYGLRSQWRSDGGMTLLAQGGQNFHSEKDNPFPYSRDPDSHFSDYVGRLAVQADPVELSYRFRLDQEELDPIRHEVGAQYVKHPVSFSASYIRLDEDISIRDSQEILGAATWAIDDRWAVSAFGRRDLLDGGRMIEAGGGLTWHNECVTLLTGIRRDFTRDREVEPSTSFTVRLLLKNL